MKSASSLRCHAGRLAYISLVSVGISNLPSAFCRPAGARPRSRYRTRIGPVRSGPAARAALRYLNRRLVLSLPYGICAHARIEPPAQRQRPVLTYALSKTPSVHAAFGSRFDCASIRRYVTASHSFVPHAPGGIPAILSAHASWRAACRSAALKDGRALAPHAESNGDVHLLRQCMLCTGFAHSRIGVPVSGEG